MLALATLAAHPAHAGNPAAAIRANQWDAAAAAVARDPDPVARTLVRYYRMLAPGAASADEIAAFMTAHPTWPDRARLEHRREEALAASSDPAVLARGCADPPSEAVGLLACAAVAGPAEAAQDARRAWPGTLGQATELAFLRQWSDALKPEDFWRKFETLAWSGNRAVIAQIPRLDGRRRRMAYAWLALRRDDPRAPALLAAIGADANDPLLILEHARYLRRIGHVADALALWMAAGAEPGAAHAGAFWAERDALARALLLTNAGADAYALVTLPAALSPTLRLDADFLAGFIALRFLHDPVRAEPWFHALTISHAAITQARAHFWLGEAERAAGQDARDEYAQSAAWPFTYYGQLAAGRLGETPGTLATAIRAPHDPRWTRAQARALVDAEFARAALHLVAWGEPRRARAFLLALGLGSAGLPEQALAAHFAAALEAPEIGVAIARRVGSQGGVLPDAGWPTPFPIPGGRADRALALGVIRQESSFDPEARSPSDALGLMQLLPATAREVAARIGAPGSRAMLTADPAYNIRLGTTYLGEMLDRFGGSAPLAAAAYNAGPRRVTQWLAGIGDPKAVGIIDWIELIPFGETRNYVQRVMENQTVYRARAANPS